MSLGGNEWSIKVFARTTLQTQRCQEGPPVPTRCVVTVMQCHVVEKHTRHNCVVVVPAVATESTGLWALVTSERASSIQANSSTSDGAHGYFLSEAKKQTSRGSLQRSVYLLCVNVKRSVSRLLFRACEISRTYFVLAQSCAVQVPLLDASVVRPARRAKIRRERDEQSLVKKDNGVLRLRRPKECTSRCAGLTRAGTSVHGVEEREPSNSAPHEPGH